MTSRSLNIFASGFAGALLAGLFAMPASAAPVQKAAFVGGAVQATLIADRGGRGHGDRDRGRHWRGRDNDRGHYRGTYYRPHYRPYYPPRYVYTPPYAYYPYDDYGYDTYYRPYAPYGSSGYFSYSSPSLGLSFGY